MAGQPTQPDARPRPKPGFTLAELLIVIGLIVLIVTLAIPAFSLITGSRSIEAAENQISSLMGRARLDAIALQEPHGVILYTDADTGWGAALPIYYPDPSGEPERIEALPDREAVYMPVGVGVRVIGNSGDYYPRGVIMFDREGRVTVRAVAIPSGSASNSAIHLAMDPNGNQSPYAALSHLGFVLYPTEAYDALPNRSTDPFNAVSQGEKEWLQDNAVPFLINRYNGSLLRGE